MKKSTTAKGEYLSLISTSTARNPNDCFPSSGPSRFLEETQQNFHGSFPLFAFFSFSGFQLPGISQACMPCVVLLFFFISHGVSTPIFDTHLPSSVSQRARVVVYQSSAPPSAGRAASPAPAWTSRDSYHWESLAASAAHSVEAPGAPHSCSVAPAPSQPAAPVAPAAPGAPEKPAAPASQSPGAAWKPDSMAAGPSSSAAAFSSSALSSASASGSRSCYHVSFFLVPNEGVLSPRSDFKGTYRSKDRA